MGDMHSRCSHKEELTCYKTDEPSRLCYVKEAKPKKTSIVGFYLGGFAIPE